MSDVIVLRDATPTAKKSHDCNECGRSINPGETYRSQTNVSEGRRYTWKACGHCDKFTSDLLREHRDLIDPWGEGISTFDLDLQEVAMLSPLWARRAALFRKRWTRRDGLLHDYPTPPPTDESDGA